MGCQSHKNIIKNNTITIFYQPTIANKYTCLFYNISYIIIRWKFSFFLIGARAT